MLLAMFVILNKHCTNDVLYVLCGDCQNFASRSEHNYCNLYDKNRPGAQNIYLMELRQNI